MPKNDEIIELIKAIHSKEEKTQKLGQNNTYVSIGVLIVVVGGVLWIAQSLAEVKQDMAEVKVQMNSYVEELREHKDIPFHDGMRPYTDQNFVSQDMYKSILDDVIELKADIAIVQETQQEILIELRSR